MNEQSAIAGSLYFTAHLRDQFDAILPVNRTTALEPLEPGRTRKLMSRRLIPLASERAASDLQRVSISTP